MLSRHASTLRVQGARLDQAGQAAAALELGVEAVQVAREAVAANRGADLRTLAGVLEEQAARLYHSRNVAPRGKRQPRRQGKENEHAAYAMARKHERYGQRSNADVRHRGPHHKNRTVDWLRLQRAVWVPGPQLIDAVR